MGAVDQLCKLFVQHCFHMLHADDMLIQRQPRHLNISCTFFYIGIIRGKILKFHAPYLLLLMIPFYHISVRRRKQGDFLLKVVYFLLFKILGEYPRNAVYALLKLLTSAKPHCTAACVIVIFWVTIICSALQIRTNFR